MPVVRHTGPQTIIERVGFTCRGNSTTFVTITDISNELMDDQEIDADTLAGLVSAQAKLQAAQAVRGELANLRGER